MNKVDLQRVLDLDAQATDGPWELDPEVETAAEQRGAIAAQLCLADGTMEHHEQTDDFPCTRCIKEAGRAIENRADRLEDDDDAQA